MQKKLLTLFILTISVFTYGQFSTGVVNLTTARTIRIDTTPSMVTMTLTGPSNVWLGIGFGGFSMAETTDMFIWSASANRDYMAPGGRVTPNADAANAQSWTIVTDVVTGTTRTIVATRALVSTGDFTFLNNNSPINIIYAQGSSTTLGNHGANPHDVVTLQRTALGNEAFSLNNATIFPNPSHGIFTIETQSTLNKISIYSHTGAFIKTVDVLEESNSVKLDLTNMSTGVYLIELQGGSEKSWKKIAIE
ncbi:MAG: hypothetical protein CFE24_06020 [Flavobacterium sp. BFFFF2]|nr:MAG: hypothetical protein CFE24_06020 [Flavobacterium sp. BFFFF2]